MRATSFLSLAAVGFIGLCSARSHAAVFASQVIAGQTSGLVSGYDNASVALGSPQRLVDIGETYQSVASPFNAPWSGADLVGVGAGGQLTLKFPNWVTIGGGHEVGVFTYSFYISPGFDGTNSNPATLYAKGKASVSVSNNGTDWQPISGNPITFDKPANAYTDTTDVYQSTASVPTDYGIPFTHSLSEFDGKTLSQTLGLFGNSGGGTWLDLGSSGLSQIDYIRFVVPDGITLNLDAVSINDNAVGAAVPEPASLAAIGAGLVLVARRRR